MPNSAQKTSGAYYTPPDAVRSLVQWAVHHATDRLLDPSSGDGRFLALHKRSVGVEQNEQEAAVARQRAPWALVHKGDFFSWAAKTKERFECAAGNPPFIRFQTFAGAVREQANALCESLGVPFSGLASSWAPFLVATASLLKPGGRMAFVVPAEIGHAPYAQPLLHYLCARFKDVRIVAVREKIFPELSEDAWLLYADGFGGKTSTIVLTAMSRFAFMAEPPTRGTQVSLSELAKWNFRLRPFLISAEVRDLYRHTCQHPGTRRLGEVAQVGIGYVTGANDFFHLRPSQAERLGIASQFLQPTVRNGRVLQGDAITTSTVKQWLAKDDAVLLLKLPRSGVLPAAVRKYLASDDARAASAAYKCRVRDPWYSVPDVIAPDGFLSYMSNDGPALVGNRAQCTCTNSVHMVRLAGNVRFRDLQSAWSHPFTRLSCELEGHPLGGGLLKVEPREAQRIAINPSGRWPRKEIEAMTEGLQTLREWRHCSGKEKRPNSMQAD